MKRIRRQPRRPEKRYIRKPYRNPYGVIAKMTVEAVLGNRLRHYDLRFHTNGEYVRMTVTPGIKQYRSGYIPLYGRNPISVILSSL